MIFRQLDDGPCKTYLIADGREALIVDPVLERTNAYLRALDQLNLRLRYVVDTHLHGDHISGAMALCERAGAAYVMHERSTAAGVTIRVEDGDALAVGSVVLEVMHTPGHSPESITLRLPDRILTGDLLLRGGAGRTDLPGGDPSAQWASLQRLAALPDELFVCPAHGDGGDALSTLGAERRDNPWLAPRGRDEHLDWVATRAPSPPSVATDRAGARDPRAPWVPDDALPERSGPNVNATAVPTVTTTELATMLGQQRVTILDVREPEELAGPQSPIAGAVTIPLGDLPRRIDELAGLEQEAIVVVCRSGSRSATAAAILTVAGFDRVYSLEGGMMRWRSPRPPPDGR